MANAYGWQASTPDIVKAGVAARCAVAFDASARALAVRTQVSAARRYSWLPLPLAVVALLLPYGWAWALGAIAWWVVLIVQANARGSALEAQLAEETARIRAEAAQEEVRVGALVAAADAGDRVSLMTLLDRWAQARPETIQPVSFRLTDQREAGSPPGWQLTGRALRRAEIADGVPRAGRGGRMVIDKRKATDIDEDLAQMNAAAVLSALWALFSGTRRQRVTVNLMLTPTDGEALPWVSLAGDFDEASLRHAISSQPSPVDIIRALGGDVGRCRAQRYTPARVAASTARNAALQSPVASNGVRAANTTSAVTTPRGGVDFHVPSPAARDSGAHEAAHEDPYGARSSAVDFGNTSAARVPGTSIPRPPAGLVAPTPAAGAVPTSSTVRQGAFATVARTYATYPGDASARFVAFQQYWPTYAAMAPGQLKFYFKWRNAVRRGEAPRTDLSYVFVHVYELLHVIGADGPLDAARQLERLWTAYRPTFPQLDNYLVSWTADLLAREVGQAEALAWIERAIGLGASPGGLERLLVLDRYWGTGDYATMPRSCIATLAGDPRLGDNKFYQQHNAGPEGDGWIDRAYRDAFVVTDRAVTAAEGRTPRELTVARDGLTTVTREAFGGAVYDYKRTPVVLGKVPALPEGSATITTYRNAVRYAENLLRREKGFTAKLRGVEVQPTLAHALDAHFASYIKATKPRTRVTIDLGRAKDLARESADVRARLLVGLEDVETRSDAAPTAPFPPTAPIAPPAPLGTAAAVQPTAAAPAGLLTDLVAVQATLAALSSPARSLLDALRGLGWEASALHSALAVAAGGALVGPLVDEINEHAVSRLGDILVVHEDALLVVQEDFRDEVYWVLTGTLDGFGVPATPVTPTAPASAGGTPTVGAPTTATPAAVSGPMPSTDGFGPLELRALAVLAGIRAVMAPADTLDALASEHATTTLLLLDRVNELALDSPYGDLVIDVDATPPLVYDDALSYITDLLTRVAPLLTPVIPVDPDVDDTGELAVAADGLQTSSLVPT